MFFFEKWKNYTLTRGRGMLPKPPDPLNRKFPLHQKKRKDREKLGKHSKIRHRRGEAPEPPERRVFGNFFSFWPEFCQNPVIIYSSLWNFPNIFCKIMAENARDSKTCSIFEILVKNFHFHWFFRRKFFETLSPASDLWVVPIKWPTSIAYQYPFRAIPYDKWMKRTKWYA